MIRAALLAVLTAMIVHPAQAQNMSLMSIKIYESDARLTPKNQRNYVSLLPRSSTRFVYWELTVRNHLYNIRPHSHSVVARWYNSRNVKIGETRQVFRVQSAWSSAWAAHGHGSQYAGRWRPGKYRVDIIVDGRVFTRRHFLIYDDSTVDPDNQPFQVTRVRLFEAGRRPPPANERQYTTRFSRGATRYIYAEIGGRNLLYGQRNQFPILVVRYYKEDGTYAGELILHRAIVRAGWRSAVLSSGWGSARGGTWDPGRYRVEVLMGNNNKVGETQFVVHAGDAPENMPKDRETQPTPPERPDAKVEPKAPDTKPTPPTPKRTPGSSKDLEELEKL